MSEITETSLEAATPADHTLLSNLLELYLHDLSASFPIVELGPEGRFGYPELPRYWSEPERRFAFLVRSGGKVLGFALATRGSPVVSDPRVHDVAEFFVLRRYRRSGVGRAAAGLLWQRFPGPWTVRVSDGVPGALRFWSAAVAGFTAGACTRTRRPGRFHEWTVFHFESAPR